MRGAPDIRVRLADEALRFPICIELARQGGTDYYAQALRFANGHHVMPLNAPVMLGFFAELLPASA